MIPDNKDVTILYQGGSGGFALFYFLLLSEKFVTGLKNKNIQQLIDIQYPDRLATEPRKWKHNEFWPDNNWCKTLSGRKLFLICNPLWNNEIAKQNLDITVAKFKIGTITTIEFRAAQQNYIEAAVRHSNAQYLTKLSEINLKELAGTLQLN
jgi:hypothetical protein